MPRFKDDAIVLRELDWSETSQVVVLLTREHGKIRGISKGSKRNSPSSVAKFSGGFEVLTQGEAMGVTKPTSDLATLTEWDLQQPHLALRKSLPALHAALYIVDLANGLLSDHDPHAAAFDAVADHLQVLCNHCASPELNSGGRVIAASLLAAQWRLIHEAGYRPELNIDVHTGEALPEQSSYTFDPITGGLTVMTGIGETDDPASPGPWRVRRLTAELLRRCASADGSLRLADQITLDRANRLLCVYARALLDRELNTMSLLLNPDS